MHFSWFFIAVVMGWLTAYLAEKRGRQWYPWFAVGFMFGIFGPLLLYVFPPLTVQKNFSKRPFSNSSPNTSDPHTIEVEAVIVPRSSGWYYLDQGNSEHGPHSLREIKKMWDEKILQELTFVWNETMQDWKRIGEVQDLFKYLKS